MGPEEGQPHSLALTQHFLNTLLFFSFFLN